MISVSTSAIKLIQEKRQQSDVNRAIYIVAIVGKIKLSFHTRVYSFYDYDGTTIDKKETYSKFETVI